MCDYIEKKLLNILTNQLIRLHNKMSNETPRADSVSEIVDKGLDQKYFYLLFSFFVPLHDCHELQMLNQRARKFICILNQWS